MWESYLPAADAVLKAIGWQEQAWIPVYRMRDGTKADPPKDASK